MILIVSAPDDDHVARIAPELRRRGASVLWFDLAELPARAQLSVEYEARGCPRPVLRVRDIEVDLRAATAVWTRRPARPSPEGITDAALRDYARGETAEAWIGVTAMLDCLWVPGPRWSELRASYKPLQLQVAAELGFEIPPTLITNSPADLLDFHRRHNGALIGKTVHQRFVAPPGDPRRAYMLTEVVANRDVGHVDAVRHCPVTFQPYVDKRVELRITVVGDRAFAAEIDSQWTNHTRHDWRRFDDHHERHRVHDLPPDVAARCVALTRRLDLHVGAIDVILTSDDRYVFLEINPNGAWIGMERATGLPIGDALCDLLLAREPARASTPVPQGAPTGAAPHPVAVSPVGTPPPAAVTARPPAALDAAVQDALRYLVRLARASTRPADALAGFRRLARRHRALEMDLVWETEQWAGSVHYDALLRAPGLGTVSVALSPDRGLPWALRHAHHARESDLLRVNGRTLNMQTVMGYLDDLWYDRALVTRLIDGCLMREAVDRRGIAASDAEVRAGVRAFRRAHGLSSRDAISRWLRQRGWTAYDLEHEIRRQVIGGKLRRQLADGRVEDYFGQHRSGLDTAVIARLRVRNPAEARRIARRLARGEQTFAQLVETALAEGVASPSGTGFATVRRRDLPPDEARAIFGRARGRAFAHADGADVLSVVSVAPAQLDAPTRALITDLLLEEWLVARRAEADVQWFWGDADRAPSQPRVPRRR
jgi:putative peptide maturation system protein